MKIVCHTQGDDSWHAARGGIPSASNFKRIYMPSTGGLSQQHGAYIEELVQERILHLPKFFSGSGHVPRARYKNAAMDRGHQMEPLAVRYWEEQRGRRTWRTGFALSDCGRFGMSPDALVGSEGGVECKAYDAEEHRKMVAKGTLPMMFACQVWGSLWISGRAWWDLVLFHPDEEKAIIRVEAADVPKDFPVVMEMFYTRFEAALVKAGLK